jgi:Mrp family chromosome partitioning ATPase
VGSNHRERNLEALAREEASKLVQRVFRAGNGRAPQAVAFSGVEADGECFSICVRVAQILAAQDAGQVCLVDANFRSPGLHRYFGLENRKGLAEAVLEVGPIQNFAQRVADHNLWVMPSGSACGRPGISLSDERLQARMRELRSAFEHVIIHSSPVGLDADSLQLSRWTDGVVLVVEAHTTRREAARRVKENLEMAEVRMLGVVLNNRTFPIPEAVYRRL